MKLLIFLSLLSFSLLSAQAQEDTKGADLALISNSKNATTAEELELLKKQVEKLKEDQLKAQQLLEEEEKAGQ